MYDNREYRRVASAIADELEAVSGHRNHRIIQASLISLAERLVRTYSAVNSRFSESRFMNAAGLVWSPDTETWEVSPRFEADPATQLTLSPDYVRELDRIQEALRRAPAEGHE